MRVEHDVGSPPRGPADGLRIAKAFVANRDAERQRPGLKHAALGARRVNALFRRIELDLVLKSGDRTIRIDHERANQQSVVDQPLRSQNHGDLGFGRGCGDDGPGVLEETAIGSRH